MIDIDHKRRQARAKADETGEAWVLFTDPADFDPPCLCDCPLAILPSGMETVEIIHPRTTK